MTTAAIPTDLSNTTTHPTASVQWSAFGSLLLRDVLVVWKTKWAFLLRTIMQPLLFVFVFGYVFPKIGQGIGGSAGAAQFSTLLGPGLIAVAIIFQGIQSVALPMVQEFGYTREIEDRVMAPVPVWAVGAEKIASGACQSLFAAFVLITLVPLCCLLAGALGLTVGTRVEPRQVPLIFSVLVLPMTMLGAAYYPWTKLGAIPWLKVAVLINPLVYMCEGMRMGMTNIPHMNGFAIYGAIIGFTVALTWIGIDGFRKRVLS
jgi:ABC-2 type transport system permease protein